jgi:hypothetical protein
MSSNVVVSTSGSSLWRFGSARLSMWSMILCVVALGRGRLGARVFFGFKGGSSRRRRG